VVVVLMDGSHVRLDTTVCVYVCRVSSDTPLRVHATQADERSVPSPSDTGRRCHAHVLSGAA